MLNLRTVAGLALVGSLGALAGCLVTNSNHCGINQGSCEEGFECSVCAVENNGCVPAGSIANDACVFVGSGPDTSTSDPSTQGPDPTLTETTLGTDTTDTTAVDPTTVEPTSSTSTSETTDTTVTTDSTTQATDCEGDIVENSGCGGVAPYCVEGTCVSCKMIECAGSFPDKPTCNENLGVCVECVDDNDCDSVEEPACNVDTATCEGCTEHAQCAETACNFETGQCFPEESVFFVDRTLMGVGIACADKDGNGLTPETPFCTLQEAMGRVVEGVPTTIKIKNGVSHQELPTGLPAGDFVLAIVNYGAVSASMVTKATDPMLSFETGNVVFIHGLNLRNPQLPVSAAAVRCDGGPTGARVWLDRMRISNTKTAIQAKNCIVHVRRSVVSDHQIGGIDLTSDAPLAKAKLWLENTYVTDIAGIGFGGVRLSGATSAEIVYSTIALNSDPQVECLNLAVESEVKIRNSAIVGAEPQIQDCSGDPPDPTNFLSPETSQAKLGGVFSSFSSGEYQAKFGGALANVATWMTGDPKLDFDGNKRPTGDGEMDYAGADRRE